MDRETTPTALGNEEGTAGSGRALILTIPSSTSVLRSNSERVSLVYRNDDGVNASTESTVFHVDEAESIAPLTRQPSEKGGTPTAPLFSHLAEKCGDRERVPGYCVTRW